MTLDKAIAHAREEAKEIRESIIDGSNLEPYELYCNAMTEQCAKEHEQLAEWLEELKELRNMTASHLYAVAFNRGYLKAEKEVREKAIDDFVKFANTMPTVETEDGEIRPMWLEEMAEQLKAGD